MIINYFYTKNFSLKLLLVLFSIAILQVSCNENLIPSEEDDTKFSFNVKVVDDSNNLIAGIIVGSYYHPSYPFPKEGTVTNITKPMASSVISFTLERECIVNLSVYNLENVKVQTLIDDNKKTAGNFAVNWNATGLKGSVYKIIIIVSDTTEQNILFNDSIYAALLHLDPEYCKMGITDSNGIFITDDKTYYPSLYTLPDLVRTAEDSPDPLGLFSITNQITIQLTDTLLNITKKFIKTIGKGKNDFVLKFSEGTNVIYKSVEVGSIPKLVEKQSIIPKVKVNWNLEQNYPNPFN